MPLKEQDKVHEITKAGTRMKFPWDSNTTWIRAKSSVEWVTSYNATRINNDDSSLPYMHEDVMDDGKTSYLIIIFMRDKRSEITNSNKYD